MKKETKNSMSEKDTKNSVSKKDSKNFMSKIGQGFTNFGKSFGQRVLNNVKHKYTESLKFLDFKWVMPNNFYTKRTQHILRFIVMLAVLTALIVGILSLVGYGLNAFDKNKTTFISYNINNYEYQVVIDSRNYILKESFVGLLYGDNAQTNWGTVIVGICTILGIAQVAKLYGKNGTSNNFTNSVVSLFFLVLALGLLSNSYALIPIIFALLVQSVITYHAVQVKYMKKSMFTIPKIEGAGN